MPTLTVKPASARPTAASGETHPMAWAGLVLAIAPMLVRASTSATTLPSWDLDPLLYPLGTNALTPFSSMLCDAASLIGAALLLLGAARSGIRPSVPTLLLTLIGAVAIVLHGWVLGPAAGTLGNQRVGSAWLSAMVVAGALWHSAQDARLRRVAVGVVLGFVVVLALLGAVQVLVIHAQTVADYRADPDRMLAAHGWSAESPMAKSFVRRLMQPEATGWFGFSNVFATFVAAGAVGGLGLLWASIRAESRQRRAVLGSALLALAGFAGLWFAQSKGGFIAAGAGAGALPVLYLLAGRPSPMSRRIAGLLGLAAIIGPIVLVLIRGAIGERIGELSLLFRSFYIEAAAMIFAAHPLAGVGPDGFQRAFTAVKPALCPEEVSSPHVIVFDWTATLGTFGLAWVCLLVRWAWGAGWRAVEASRATTPAEPLDRESVRVLLLIPAAATIAAAFIEAAMTTPDMALVRIGGLVLWCLAGWTITMAVTESVAGRVAVAGAAVAAIAHGQIDVAASLSSSAGLWATLVVLAAAPAGVVSRPSPGADRSTSGALLAGAAACGVLALLVGLTSITTVYRWERRLDAAADTVRPVAEFTDRLRALQGDGASATLPRETLDAVVRDLGIALGRTVAPTAESVNGAMTELEGRLLPAAAKQLGSAFEMEPSDRRVLREASRLHLRLAERAFGEGREAAARAHWADAVRVLRLTGPGAEGTIEPGPSDWHWLGSVHEHAAGVTGDPAEYRAAIKARLRIVPLDPHNLDNARRIFRDARGAGDEALAREWAIRCLALDKDMRLDRETRGLSDADRTEIEKAAR